MAAVAVAAAVPAALIIGGDDPDQPQAEIVLDEGNAFESRALSVSGSAPLGWTVSTSKDHVIARSGSGLGRVVITVPGPASDAKALLREAVDALEVVFASAEPSQTLRNAQIDGRPTLTKFVALERGDGREVQAVVTVAQGAEETYLVEVFVTEGAAPRRFGEAQAVIDSLELSG